MSTMAIDIGNGTGSTFYMNHNLGTRDLQVQVRRNSDDRLVYPRVRRNRTDRVDIVFINYVPTVDEFRVIVQKPERKVN